MRQHTRRGAIALAAAGAAALVGVPTAAHAADYPSWSDVLKARGNVKEKQKQIARLQGLLAASRKAAEAAQQEAEQRGTVYQAARARVDEAADRLKEIQAQVDEQEQRAKEATERAGQLAAQLTRSGGTDPQTTLLLSGDDDGGPEGFLSRLGRLSKLTESNGEIAAEATAARNAADATRKQLQEAKDQLVQLQDQAKVAYDAAVKASAAANEKVQQQEATQVELEARLKALQATSDSLARRYQAGVAAQRAAQQAGAAGSVTAGGWAEPAYGPITGVFGPRPNQPAGANYFHRGTDIGAGYGSPIYAAHAGTVVYAGWYGTYGYFIEVDNGGGISTGYAHIRPGGIFVHVGESVSAGQNIASVGATGAATGPHLHFETRIDEVAVNAQPFMAARGITLG